MKYIKNILDIERKAVTVVKELPKGKPITKTVVTNGAYQIYTYIFKQGVFIKDKFKGKTRLFMKKPEIVNGKGEFLR